MGIKWNKLGGFLVDVGVEDHKYIGNVEIRDEFELTFYLI